MTLHVILRLKNDSWLKRTELREKKEIHFLLPSPEDLFILLKTSATKISLNFLLNSKNSHRSFSRIAVKLPGLEGLGLHTTFVHFNRARACMLAAWRKVRIQRLARRAYCSAESEKKRILAGRRGIKMQSVTPRCFSLRPMDGNEKSGKTKNIRRNWSIFFVRENEPGTESANNSEWKEFSYPCLFFLLSFCVLHSGRLVTVFA